MIARSAWMSWRPRATARSWAAGSASASSVEQDFISDQYFALLRNYRRHGWLILYLFGNSPAICPSFLQGILDQWTPLAQTNPELVQKATDVWSAIGSQVLKMSAENHDAAFAATFIAHQGVAPDDQCGEGRPAQHREDGLVVPAPAASIQVFREEQAIESPGAGQNRAADQHVHEIGLQ